MQFTSRQKVLLGLGALFAIMLSPLLFIGDTGTGGHLELTPTNISADTPVTNQTELRADQQQLIEQAATGSATAYGYNPTAQLHEYVVLNGTYYRVWTNQTNTTAHVEKPVAIVEPVTNASNVTSLFDYSHDTTELLAPPTGSNGTHTVVLQPDTPGRSELLPTPAYRNVTWQGDQYSIRVENRTVEQPVYTVSAHVVAKNRSAFSRYLTETTVRGELTGDQLSDDERTIVEQAIDDGYSEDEPYSEAFRSVLNIIYETGGDATPGTTEVYLRYNGELYRATFSTYGWG